MKGSTVILVLSILEQEAMYGYQIVNEIEKKSSGLFRLKEGTLYPLLHALEADGALESFWREGDGKRQRRYYRLTDRGRQQLHARRAEWNLFRSAVDQVIGESAT